MKWKILALFIWMEEEGVSGRGGTQCGVLRAERPPPSVSRARHRAPVLPFHPLGKHVNCCFALPMRNRGLSNLHKRTGVQVAELALKIWGPEVLETPATCARGGGAWAREHEDGTVAGGCPHRDGWA